MGKRVRALAGMALEALADRVCDQVAGGASREVCPVAKALAPRTGQTPMATLSV